MSTHARSGVRLWASTIAAVVVGLVASTRIARDAHSQTRDPAVSSNGLRARDELDASVGVASAHTLGAFDGGDAERAVIRAIRATNATDASIVDATARPSARPSEGCPEDMVVVQGRFCNEVYEPCERWADNDRDQCLEFIARPHCTGQRIPMSFCMDRYEWPNREGALPSVMVSYVEAEALCASRGRRLCTEDEWTFACSGEQLLPYPYGRERSADACTIDLFARAPNKPLLHSTDRATREAEVERTYMATPSGSRPRCVSPFAVHDMTGNVDEWVRSTANWGQPSGLMGGFWGHVRNRCRAVTRSHGPSFRYYQIGFRCCADRPAARAPTRGAV